jgi:hypothetical protein
MSLIALFMFCVAIALAHTNFQILTLKDRVKSLESIVYPYIKEEENEEHA